MRQALAQGIVNLFEEMAGCGEGFRQITAHTYHLRALPGEHKSSRHRRSPSLYFLRQRRRPASEIASSGKTEKAFKSRPFAIQKIEGQKAQKI
jgi:hypothetical protein